MLIALGVAVGKVFNSNCPRCGERMEHMWHTSSREVDRCANCGYVNDSKHKN